MMTTFGPPGVSSSAVKLRPSEGVTPKIGMQLAVTVAPERRSGSPTPPGNDTLYPCPNTSPKSVNERCSARQSR